MNEKALAILVHGFNVWDGGRATVGKLRPFFAEMGIPYIMVNYGHFGLLETRFKNRKVAEKVAACVSSAKTSGRKVIVCGHSNGCAITHLAASEFGAVIDLAVYINPALKANILFPENIKRCQVWHSPSDSPVKWAKFLPASNARPWGEMGATGYTGHDRRVQNYDKERCFPVSSKEHSDIFSPEKLGFFGSFVAVNAMEALGLLPYRSD